MVIAHNIFAMNAQRQLNIVTKNKEKTTEKLSSGYRINKAADDAAGLSISEKMRRQIRGLSQGIKNTEDGVSLCQVADGALAEVSDMLHRITELSIKSANGTNSPSDREAIQEEIGEILQEIDRIGQTTTFNERKIFKGDSTSKILNHGSVVKSDLRISVSGKPTDSMPDTYSITATDAGFYIGSEPYAWSDFRDTSGNTLADGNISNGKYSLTYHGMKVSVDVTNSGLDDIASALNGLSWTTQVQNTTGTSTSVVSRIVPDTFEMKMPAWLSLNKVHLLADETGLGISYEGNADAALYWDYNYGSRITNTWDSLGIDINNIAAGTYTYTDARTGLNYQFQVESGATKDRLIDSLNQVVMTVDNLVESEWTYHAPTSKFGNIPPNSVEDYETCYLASYFNPTKDSMADILENDINPEMYSTGSTDSKYNYTLTDDGKLCLQYMGAYQCRHWRDDLAVNPVSDGTKFVITDESMQKLRNFDYTKNSPRNFDSSNGSYSVISDDRVLEFKSDSGSTIYMQIVNVTQNGYDPTENSFDDIYEDFLNNTEPYSIYVSLRNVKRTMDFQEVIANSSGGNQSTDIIRVDKELFHRQETEDIISGQGQYKVLSLWIQSGCDVGDGMFLEIDRMDASFLGIDDLDVSTIEGAYHAMDAVDGALEKLSASRSRIGAQQNRLEHIIDNENNIVENTTAAESRIRDTDMADEMVAFSMSNILEQAGQAMLAQANQSNQSVLSLLQ